MKVLVGTIVVGPSKLYAVPKFEEMCRVLLPDVDVVAVVDHPSRTSLPQLRYPVEPSFWATEIVYHGKRLLGEYALEAGYDAVVWQGIDCYYETRRCFDLLVRDAEKYPIVGGLVAGRNMPGYAVCRRYVGGGFGQKDHVELRELRPFQGVRQIRGYVGSDATVIRRDALERVSMDGYEHWHLRKDSDSLAVGPEEFFMWSAINRNKIVPACDMRVRPWHFHETGLGARYPGETCRLDSLHWDSRNG